MKCALTLLLVGFLLVTGDMTAAAPQAGERTVYVRVRPGDNITRIALRHGVSAAEVRRWNPRKVGKDDMIRAGDKLVIKVPGGQPVDMSGPTWEGWYDIKRGDTLGRVARKLGVSIEQLREWNGLRPRAVIRAGKLLRYVKPGEGPDPASLGRPTAGRLVGAQHLGKGRGYRLRFPKNAFGLPSVNETLKRCPARVADKFRGTADILIGDISHPTGGRFPPHVSHQTGRDADVGYYLKGNKQNVTMHRVGPRDLDYAKNWALLKCFLSTDKVVRVYMDTAIQKAMAAWLQKKGKVSAATLARLFEVRAEDGRSALIRHAPGHDTHIHIRFACDAGDEDCEEESDDAVFRF